MIRIIVSCILLAVCLVQAKEIPKNVTLVSETNSTLANFTRMIPPLLENYIKNDIEVRKWYDEFKSQEVLKKSQNETVHEIESIREEPNVINAESCLMKATRDVLIAYHSDEKILNDCFESYDHHAKQNIKDLTLGLTSPIEAAQAMNISIDKSDGNTLLLLELIYEHHANLFQQCVNKVVEDNKNSLNEAIAYIDRCVEKEQEL